MHRLSTYIIAVMAIATTVAAAATAKGDNTYELRGVRVEGDIATDSIAPGMVWDFSGLRRTGDATLRYVGRGDTAVMELSGDCRLDFAVDSNSVRLTCVEGRNWRVAVDSLAIDGQTTVADSATLSRDLSYGTRLKGVFRQSYTVGHTVITDEADTLRDVGLLSLSFYNRAGSGRMDVRRLYWLTKDNRRPLAVATIIEPSYLRMEIYGRDDGNIHQTAHRQPPPSPFAAISPAGGEGDTFLPRKAERENRSPDAVAPKIVRQPDECPELRFDGRSLTIDCGGASDCRITEIMVSDIMGRVYPGESSGDEAVWGQLPPGDYIVSYIKAGCRMSVKIHIET